MKLKNVVQLNILAYVLLFTFSVNAQNKTLIQCKTQNAKIIIELTDIQNPLVHTEQAKNLSAVITSDSEKIELTSADFETLAMTVLEFKISDLKMFSKYNSKLSGKYSRAEGPGSIFQAENMVCKANNTDRIQLLKLSSLTK